METDIVIYILSVACAIALGANIGFARGLKRGIDISMEIAITQTIKRLYAEFDKFGEGDQFKEFVNKVFDINKLNLWEDEE